MSKINILPDSLVNKIAAGEVVQRPESALKELLENSIDAGATEISVIIKGAGKSLLQVIDNGEGMSEEDALVSIKKHATSKIKTFDDLTAIRSLGFRGEALSSIASVSQFEIRTERREDEIGTLIRIEEEEKITKEKGSFPKGTSVSVKNLFYNTPARRNFLRSDSTELKRLIDIFKKIALIYPNIFFKFYNDEELIFNYPIAAIDERIQSVFGESMLNALIPVNEITEYISLQGYIGKPSLIKRARGEQYLFLNKRLIQSKQVNHAVFSAYENVVEKGEYPFFILFLDVDPSKVDVNVHPSKYEVRFEDENDIYAFVVSVVRKSLASHDLVPNLSFSEKADGTKLQFDPFVFTEKKNFEDRPARPSSPKPIPYSSDDIELLFGQISATVDRRSDVPLEEPFDAAERIAAKSVLTISSSPGRTEETGFIIQLHQKYILSEIKSGLMIIDQHVAHERILYEKVLKLFEANFPFSQQLLFPKTIKLDPGSFLIVKELDSYLNRLGFAIKYFSDNTIILEGVPQDIKNGEEEDVLTQMIDEYIENQKIKKLEQRDNLAKSFACKASIKAGDKLNQQEMRVLIDQLFATSMPYVCPHGRPIVVKISLDEFDRRFGRT